MEDEEKKSLMNDVGNASSSDVSSFEDYEERQVRKSSAWKRICWNTYIYGMPVIVILLGVALAVKNAGGSGGEKMCMVGGNGEIYSPAAHFAKKLITKTERSNGTLMHSAFTGAPNEGNTRAWEDLVRPVLFNATAEEITLSGLPLNDTVRVVAGGYMASLGVYHELHCLRRLRLWLYRDTYFPNATADDEAFMLVHLDHCIEILRLSSMCTADLGVYSFIWGHPGAEKPTARSAAPRQCVDWTPFEEWAKERMLPGKPLLFKDDRDKR